MSNITKLLLKTTGIGASAFAALFTVYFLNLDMKMLSKIEPFLLKHYDRMPRNVRI